MVNVNLELTDHCNLRCPMCSQSLRAQAHGVPKRFMDWETWRAALRGLAGMPEPVQLCPHWLGEPTMHPEFDAMLDYAFAMNWGNRLFRNFKLHTNGIRVSPERSCRLIHLATRPHMAEDTFASVHFSIDAYSNAVYERVKGRDARTRVYDNVDAFLAAREKAGSSWPHVHLAFVVQPENAADAEAFVQYWSHRLDGHNLRWTLAADWPPQDRDAIYLRPLNCSDQAAANDLHARVCRSLGVGNPTHRLRSGESF